MRYFLGQHLPLLLLLLIGFSSFAYSVTCPYTPWDKTAIVQQINDGDTITLSGGQRVRFIGINTPEINYRHLHKSAPYALQAKALIEKYVRIGDPVHLVFDNTKRDKYGRLLAYVYSKTGRNLSILQLQSGFAKQWVIGDNDRFWQCQQQAEKQARLANKGIWAEFEPLLAAKLTKKDKGYQYIRGEISAVKLNQKGLRLTLGNRLTIWISVHHLSRFSAQKMTFNQGDKLLVTGKVFLSRDQLKMNIYHPVQVLNE